MLLDEILCKLWDIGAPLPQWRDDDGYNVQPIEKVFPKRASLDLILQVFIGGSDDPDIDLDGLPAPNPPHLPFLQGAQYLGLQVDVQLADLVQEQRALIGRLEEADTTKGSPGERTLLVAEQFALDEGLRNRGATDRHEWSLPPRAV